MPELSLVSEVEEDGQPRIVGHIFLTKIRIKNEKKSFESLALAPVSVLPKFHGKGIGGKLITHAHDIAKDLGFESVVLLGHQDYYPRFGYRPTVDFGIELPFDVPAENCMAVELVEHGLSGVSGMVEYPPEFQR